MSRRQREYHPPGPPGRCGNIPVPDLWAGISGGCDRDTFNGSLDDLSRLWSYIKDAVD